MSDLRGGAAARSLAFFAGFAYFIVLCIALVWWHLSPEIIVLLTVGGIALTVLSLRPYIGVQAFIVVLFLENILGSGEGITPMKAIGAVILAGWLLNVTIRRRTGLRLRGFILTSFLFLVWNFVCFVYAIDEEAALARLFTYVQLALAAMMFASVVDTASRLRGVYWTFVIGTVIATIVAVVEYYAGITQVAVGFLVNRNLLATYLNVAIVFASLLLQDTREGARRTFLMASLPVLFLGLALTFSRGGLIVLAPTLMLVWYRVARQKRISMLIGSFAMICVVIYILPLSFWTRAGSIIPAISKQQDTFGTRVHLWRVAIRMVEDRPLFGVGPGNYIPAFPRYARGGEIFWGTLPTHNAYFGVLAESGLIGGTIFLILCGLALAEARRGVLSGRRSGRSDVELVSLAAAVGLLAIVLTGLSGNVEAHKILWMLFGLALASGALGRRVATETRASMVRAPSPAAAEDWKPWSPAHVRQ